ncbi:MAG: hypothetical protein HQK51_05460 [Oligoflexia bacterium]|nr:hypothetical protein [Oligoflexia bacterium]
MNVKEALQVLESAAASGSEDIKSIFSSDYQNLMKTIMKSAPNLAWEKVKNAKEAAVDYTIDKTEVLNKCVHEHPWYYIGGAAFISVGIGFLLGRSMK